MKWSTLSTTGPGGGNSGTRCNSGTAGGCWMTIVIGAGLARSSGGPLELLPRDRCLSWRRPGTWSRSGTSSWPCAPCTGWRASCVLWFVVAWWKLGSDVSVNMQLKFQQSFVFVFMPQIGFHRQSAGHFSFATKTGTHSAKLCRGPCSLHRCSSWCGLVAPSLCYDRCWGLGQCRKP